MREKLNFKHLGSIFLINLGVKWIIDTPFNLILMVEFGYTISVITTTILYIIIGIISVKLYDHHKKDIFHFEKYKYEGSIKKYDNKIIAILMIVVNFFKSLAVGFVLSLKNTGLPVILFREGSYLYNGFPGIIIKLIFLIYALLINVIWNTIIYFCSPFFIMVWEIIKKIFLFMFQNFIMF